MADAANPYTTPAAIAANSIVADDGLRVWSSLNVLMAALMMVATFPGRTQGLGMATEGILRDLSLDGHAYAQINLWATLIGGLFCLPVGYLIDRLGSRWVSAAIVASLGFVVWWMSNVTTASMLFGTVLLTRGLGQSALSVASISVVAKWFGRRNETAMAAYSFLGLIFFAIVSVVIGYEVRTWGWRTAWASMGWALLCLAPLCYFLIANPRSPESQRPGESSEDASEQASCTLGEALRSPAFWIYGGATSLFGLVSSGVGLFSEAILAERNFTQLDYHTTLSVSFLVVLVSQIAFGLLNRLVSLRAFLAAGMAIYAAALLMLPGLSGHVSLYVYATLMGISGGIVMIVFFAIWAQAFGPRHVGRIQGAAQMMTVLASAVGPAVFEMCKARVGSYSPLFWTLAPLVLLFGVAGLWMPTPGRSASAAAVTS